MASAAMSQTRRHAAEHADLSRTMGLPGGASCEAWLIRGSPWRPASAGTVIDLETARSPRPPRRLYSNRIWCSAMVKVWPS